MKQLLLISLVIFIGIPLVAAETANPIPSLTPMNVAQIERDKQEIIRLENELFQASNQKDAATLNRLLADDLVATSTDGKIADKKKIIAFWTKKTPDAPDEVCALSDSRISVFGATAVVVALDTCKVRDKDGERTVFQDSFTDLWMKRNGQWQLVATTAPPFKSSQNAISDAQVERDKQEIIRLNDELSRASEKDRAAVLMRLLDDNFVSFATSNQPRNKARVLRSWATPNTDPLVSYSLTSSDFQFYFYGDTAIVTSRTTDVLSYQKSETTNRTFEFDVWKKSEKGWRRIAHRSTPIRERKAVVVDAKTLDAYAGIYQSADGNSFTVTREGEKLFVSIVDGTKFELPREGAKIDLLPQTEIEFYSPSDPYITMFFVRDEKGEVARAIVRYYTADTTIRKTK